MTNMYVFGLIYENGHGRVSKGLRDQSLIRDWSLITGRGGGLQNGKTAGPKLFAPPPSRQGKSFGAPPLLKSGNFPRPAYNMAKTSSYRIKTTPKLFVPPFSMAQTFSIPPFRRGKTSRAPPRFVAPPPSP